MKRYLDFKPKKTQDGTWLLKTNKTLHGWCLPWHQQLYNCTIFHGIEGLQAMLRLGNMRRQFELFLECHIWSICAMHLLSSCRTDGNVELGEHMLNEFLNRSLQILQTL
jgi:hypothetical protein